MKMMGLWGVWELLEASCWCGRRAGHLRLFSKSLIRVEKGSAQVSNRIFVVLLPNRRCVSIDQDASGREVFGQEVTQPDITTVLRLKAANGMASQTVNGDDTGLDESGLL